MARSPLPAGRAVNESAPTPRTELPARSELKAQHGPTAAHEHAPLAASGPAESLPVPESWHSQRLVALFVAGLMLFNFPLLVVWGQDATVFGLPLLPVAMFGLWAMLIALLAVTVERARR